MSLTQLLTATVAIAHMINTTIASAFHNNEFMPDAHLEALYNKDTLCGSGFETVDVNANCPNIPSSVHSIGKISSHTALKFAYTL